MDVTSRVALSCVGLLALFVASSAVAAPFELPKHKPNQHVPLVNPSQIYPNGLRQIATVNPRTLYSKGVAMDIQRAWRTLASTNRVQLSKHTQMWLEFDGAAGKGYRMDCKFTNNPQIHLMEYINGRVVRQARSNPVAGNLSHLIGTNINARKIKIWFQPTKNTDWSQCRISPTS